MWVHFGKCCKILNTKVFDKMPYANSADPYANSADPDQTAPEGAGHMQTVQTQISAPESF